MSSVAASAAADFLNQLAQEGTAVAWKQRTVTGKDSYGQPTATFNAQTIRVLIRLMKPADVKLVDAGFQMQHYLWMHYDPSLNIQMLDKITYGSTDITNLGAGTDYEVRLSYPYLLEGVAIYGVALLRFITE